MNIAGVVVGLGALLIVGVLHPVVVKVEYRMGTRAWPLFLIAGLAGVAGACLIWDTLISPLLSALGFALLWGVRELFEQKKRVEKGWYPRRRAGASMMRLRLFHSGTE